VIFSSRFVSYLMLAAALLCPAAALQAQVQVVDEDTELPDYSVYYEGVEARDAGDMATAVALFTEAAENGLAIAQHNLGVLYFSGEGVPQDYEQAFLWTQRAAEQGYVRSMVNLGVLYYNQLGVQPSWMSVWPLSLINRGAHYEQAARWYGEAAGYDDGEAQYYLATMYHQGLGVDRDLAQAYMWARLAQDNEVALATQFLNTLETEMSAAQRSQGQRDYANWVLENRS